MHLGGFGGEFACSRALGRIDKLSYQGGGGGGEGPSLTDVLVVFYLLLQSVPIDNSKG